MSVLNGKVFRSNLLIEPDSCLILKTTQSRIKRRLTNILKSLQTVWRTLIVSRYQKIMSSLRKLLTFDLFFNIL